MKSKRVWIEWVIEEMKFKVMQLKDHDFLSLQISLSFCWLNNNFLFVKYFSPRLFAVVEKSEI